MKHLKIQGRQSEMRDVKNFVFSKSNRYAVFPNKKSSKVSIIKMSTLYNTFSSDILPVVDTWQNYLGLLEGNQINLYSLSQKAIERSILLGTKSESLISFNILNSSKLLLHFKDRIKLIDFYSGKVLASVNVDYKGIVSQPHYEIRQNYVAVSNSDEVFVISLNNDLISIIKLSPIKRMASLDVMEWAGYLVISGLLVETDENSNGFVVLIVALKTMSVVKKISLSNEFKPVVYNDLIVVVSLSSLIVFQMSCNLKRIDLNFEGFKYLKPLHDNKYLTFINDTKLLVVDLLNNLNQISFNSFSPSYLLEISKNEEFFMINTTNCLEIYDPSFQVLLFYIKYYKIKYTKILVLDCDLVLLYNTDLKFKIFDTLNSFSLVKEIKVKNEPPQEVEIKVHKNFIFIGGINFFVLFDLTENSIYKYRVMFYQIKESGFVVFRKISGKLKCLNLNTGKSKVIFSRKSETIISDVLDMHTRVVVYEASSKTCSLDLII